MVRMLAFIPLATPVWWAGTEAITTPARLEKTRPEPDPLDGRRDVELPGAVVPQGDREERHRHESAPR